MVTPARLAKNFTASGNASPSIFMMKEKALPPTPHPKQWKMFRAGLTLNEGVFSPWNGHSPW